MSFVGSRLKHLILNFFMLGFQQSDKLEAKISCKRRKNPFTPQMGSLGAALGPRAAVGSLSSLWEPSPLLHRRKDSEPSF